jgi:hypothetical protein
MENFYQKQMRSVSKSEQIRLDEFSEDQMPDGISRAKRAETREGAIRQIRVVQMKRDNRACGTGIGVLVQNQRSFLL